MSNKTINSPVVKRTSVFILAGLLFAPGLRTQEHAPTMDVCRADRAAWHNTGDETDYLKQETKRINDDTKNRNPIAKLSFREVNLREQEMATCASVDEPNFDKYHEMVQFYSGVTADRYRSFIHRHHLFQRLVAEDDAGIR